MISFRRSHLPTLWSLYARSSLRLCSSSASLIWDPTVSLRLEHPILFLLEKCRTLAHFKEILAQMMKFHLTHQTFPMSRLLYFSAVSYPEHLHYALLLFKHFTPCPNLYIYNIMISALSFSPFRCLALYNSMISAGIGPDEQTFLALLKSSKYMSNCEQIHVHAIVNGFGSHIYVQNSLMKMYLVGGKMTLARQVFSDIHEKDIVSYNIMVSGLAREGWCIEVLECFHDIIASGIEPDKHTMVGLLVCSGKLKDARFGKAVHGLILRKMIPNQWSLIMSNAILDMYAKCKEMKIAKNVFDGIEGRDEFSWNIIISGFVNNGELDSAHRLFDESPKKDIVSWNSLLAGYARNGDFQTVVKLFNGMHVNSVRPDKVTAVSLVNAVAETGELNRGRCIHGWVVKLYGILDAFTGSALIDMYCKCGNIQRSYSVFEKVLEKDVTVWTAMIMSLAFHGHGTKALELFLKMQDDSLVPNSVTLVAILTACNHSGMVDEGYEIFETMKQNYNVDPGVEHYGCVVDLFARAGRLTEALNVIKTMPMKPSRSIWGAILNASNVYQNLDLAEAALRELVKLEPEEEGGYVLLSNLYAAHGKWSHSDNVREFMEHKGVIKMAGSSAVVVDDIVYEFISADKRNPRYDEIYSTISDLHRIMKADKKAISQVMHEAFI